MLFLRCHPACCINVPIQPLCAYYHMPAFDHGEPNSVSHTRAFALSVCPQKSIRRYNIRCDLTIRSSLRNRVYRLLLFISGFSKYNPDGTPCQAADMIFPIRLNCKNKFHSRYVQWNLLLHKSNLLLQIGYQGSRPALELQHFCICLPSSACLICICSGTGVKAGAFMVPLAALTPVPGQISCFQADEGGLLSHFLFRALRLRRKASLLSSAFCLILL